MALPRDATDTELILCECVLALIQLLHTRLWTHSITIIAQSDPLGIIVWRRVIPPSLLENLHLNKTAKVLERHKTCEITDSDIAGTLPTAAHRYQSLRIDTP
jgi:hypothetical protein